MNFLDKTTYDDATIEADKITQSKPVARSYGGIENAIPDDTAIKDTV